MVTAGFAALRCHPGWAGPCILYLRGARGLASLPRESHVEESSRGCGTYRGLCSARRVSRGSPHWWGWDALGGTRAGAGPGHGVPNPLLSCWVHGLGLLRDTRGSCVGLELVHFFLFMMEIACWGWWWWQPLSGSLGRTGCPLSPPGWPQRKPHIVAMYCWGVLTVPVLSFAARSQ